MTKPCPPDLAAFKHEPADYEQPVGRDNPSAFPCVHDRHLQEGMTLRDWFAGQALAGMLASVADDEAFNMAFTHAAPAAFKLADAMLVARGETSHG